MPRTTLLLADDNSSVLVHVRKMLEQDKHYSIVGAISDGAGAGGSAYVVKSRLSFDLIRAIHAVLSNKLFVSASSHRKD